jgi:hypothetical protein
MRIIHCTEGFEAQYWKEGALLNSHWWVVEPDMAVWLKFQRSSGLQPAEKIPAMTHLSMTLKAWKKGDTFNAQQTLPIEAWAWKAVLFIPIVIATWTTTEIVFLKQQLEQVKVEKEQLSRKIKPTLLAKTETYQNQQQTQILATLFNNTTQIEYIDQFFQALSLKKGLEIMSWGFTNHSIDVVIQSDTPPDPSWVVKKITELNWVDTTSTSNTGRAGQMKINIKIKE